MKEQWSHILKKAESDPRASALCIIVSTRGSTPRVSGAKMIVFEDGTLLGTIGGGALEEMVIKDALQVIRTGNPVLKRHDLLHQHGMCCGGTVEIFTEPVARTKRLYIFGAGHTGAALAPLAADAGFEVYLADSRFDYLHHIKDERIHKLSIFYDQRLQALPTNERTFICIMTHDHKADREILSHFIRRPFAYLGMIGSQRKCEITRKIFRDAGIPEALLENVDMPMGTDIQAEGPFEIAISILGKLIRVKNMQPCPQRSLS